MGRPRIVIADDHPEILQKVRELLKPEFEVVGTFADGQALILGVAELHPDVVILDITMPGISGMELARKARATHPDTRVLLISGHMAPHTGSQPSVPEGIDFLAKPFEAHELMIKIRDVLDAPSGS